MVIRLLRNGVIKWCWNLIHWLFKGCKYEHVFPLARNIQLELEGRILSRGTVVKQQFPRGHIGSIILCSIKWPPGVSVSSLPFDGNTFLSHLTEMCCKNYQLKKNPASGRLSALKRQQSNASVNQLANEQENINSQLAEQSQHESVWIKHAFGVFSNICWSEVDYHCGLFRFCLNISTVVAMANHSPVFQLIISVWTRSVSSIRARPCWAGRGASGFNWIAAASGSQAK